MQRFASSSLDSVTQTSSDDLDAMLNLLGVLTALLLSIICGLQFTIGQEEYDRADFRTLLHDSQDFRKFAKRVWQQEGRSFIVEVDVDETLDIAEVLDASHFHDEFKHFFHYSELGDQWWSDMDLVFQHMYGDFPISRMRTWIARRQFNNFPYILDSNTVIKFGMASFTCTIIAFGVSIAYYLSLLLSPIGEDKHLFNDENPKSLHAWSRFGLPVVILGYVFLMFGLIFAGMSIFNVALMRTPHTHHRWDMQLQAFVAITCCSLFNLLTPLVATACSVWASMKQRSQRLTKVVPQPDPVPASAPITDLSSED